MAVAEKEIAQLLETAVAVVVERIARLPKEDKEDLFELTKELKDAKTEEELQSIKKAFQEIIDNDYGAVRRLSESFDSAPSEALKRWMTFASQRIKDARKEASLTQEQLAEKSGLPQSHISRLERAEHSPTRKTLEKIATALDKQISYFDPSAKG